MDVLFCKTTEKKKPVYAWRLHDDNGNNDDNDNDDDDTGKR